MGVSAACISSSDHDSHGRNRTSRLAELSRAEQTWSASRLASLSDRYKTALLPLALERMYSRGETVGWNSPKLSL